MPAGRTIRLLAAVLLCTGLVRIAMARDVDPAKQRVEQKKIQQRIEEASRRATSTIDAMLFQRLSPRLESKMIEEVADSLKGLSQDEIKAILDHLEKAAQAPDPTAANKEQVQAYEKHRYVVAQLRGILVKLDVIKNLDEAAARLDRAANDQLTVNAEMLNLAAERKRPGFGDAAQEDLLDKQNALGAEIASVFKQIDALYPMLNAQQKERVDAAEVKARGSEIVSEMTQTVRKIREKDLSLNGKANELQRKHVKQLKDLATALRTPPSDKLAALKQARDKVEKALESQKKVSEETAKKPDADEPRKATAEAKREKANDLALAQAKAELDTRAARKAADAVAPEVAKTLLPAEDKQFDAEKQLRKADLEAAKEPQNKALEALKTAKDDLDKQIAAAELAKKDPLAAVKNASEQIEKAIQEQKAAAEKTNVAEKDAAKIPDAAKAQNEVAKKTDELKNLPLPPNPEAKAALDKAAENAKQAKTDLDNKNPADAKPDQKEAIKNLEKAKAALDQQAKAIEQRRDDIAKLEDAKKDLDKLALAEKKVADEAKKAGDDANPLKGDKADPAKGDKADMGKRPDTKALAEKQSELQPPTKEVGEKLKDVAPDAAKKVDEAGMKQEGAKQDLTKNMPMAGAEKANDAAKKLDEAAKAVDMKLAEERGKEANDQQALMPNNADPMAAAQQLAKAIEQANKAAEKADEAAKATAMPPMMGDMPMKGMPMNAKQPDLSELQKQVAKQAETLKQPEAAKAADDAAKALEKGDLPAAIQNQQKAVDALKKAQMAEPMMGEKGMGEKGMGEKGMGEKGMGEKGMGEKGMGEMGMAKTPGELAATQQKLQDATKALQQSQQANNAAQAALQQAQANAPMAVQPQLNKANEALNQAGQQLGMGMPMQAGMNQMEAAGALQQALDALNAAAMANGMMGTQPGQNPMANAGMMPPGMGDMQMHFESKYLAPTCTK